VEVHGTAQVFGLEVKTFFFAVTPLAGSFYAALSVVLVVTVVVLGRLYLGGRAESKGVFIGSLLLLLSGANEMAMATGWHKSVSLVPLGFSAFIYGVTLTLVTRYAQRSDALELRTAELAARSLEPDASYARLQETERALVTNAQLAAVGRLSHTISERIRVPLAVLSNTVLQLNTTNVRQASLPDAILQSIDAEAGRLAELVSRLLCYTRPATAKLTPNDLQELLAPSLAGARAIPGIDTTLRCEGLWPSVRGDTHLLRQLFDDLIANAVHSLQGTGEIAIRVRNTRKSNADAIAITISDNGVGMDEHVMARAMRPFFSTHSERHGLGLPICQRTVEVHRGSLTLKSQPNVGTTARVVLPLNQTP
jgi:signal transduction histidine kinase